MTAIIKNPFGLAVVLIVSGLAACGGPSPTGYTKANPAWTTKYGYNDKRINDDEFSIVATGNQFTSKERVAEIALLRAAYLTQESGGTHFIVMNRKTQTLQASELIAIPVMVGVPVWLPVEERVAKEPTAVLLIRLLPRQSDYPPGAVEAAAVIERLSENLE